MEKHCCASVKDLGLRWPGNTCLRPPVEAGAAALFYAHAAHGKLTAVKIEYEASTAGRSGFSSDSAQNLLKRKAAILKQSSLLDYVCPDTGLTPLMAAVLNGHLAVAHQLLTYGSKVDATGRKGRTALQQLLKHGDLLDAKMLNLLLDAGASPFYADATGMTALEYALRRRGHRFSRFPGGFKQMLQSVLDHCICAGPAEVKVSRACGLSQPWVRRYCALVPQHAAGRQQVDLQLLLLDESSLNLVERVIVKDCKKSHYPEMMQPHIHLTIKSTEGNQQGCMHGRDTEHRTMQLRAVDNEPDWNVVMQQLIELAEMHPESVQYWLQGKAATQTLTPANSMQAFAPASATKSARMGGTPLQRTDSCRWGSFRQRRHTARRSASLGIVDSSNRDILMTQPLPEGRGSNPHGVLDSADSLFDTLTFHFHGL